MVWYTNQYVNKDQYHLVCKQAFCFSHPAVHSKPHTRTDKTFEKPSSLPSFTSCS